MIEIPEAIVISDQLNQTVKGKNSFKKMGAETNGDNS